MCRWIAYRGETLAFEQYVTEPVHSLIAQSLRSLEATARRTEMDLVSVGTVFIRNPVSIGRRGRRGRTKICATSVAICSLTCSSLMSGRRPVWR